MDFGADYKPIDAPAKPSKYWLKAAEQMKHDKLMAEKEIVLEWVGTKPQRYKPFSPIRQS